MPCFSILLFPLSGQRAEDIAAQSAQLHKEAQEHTRAYSEIYRKQEDARVSAQDAERKEGGLKAIPCHCVSPAGTRHDRAARAPL